MLWQRGKAYPPELRERVFILADTGLTVGAIARTLLVSVSYVSKVLSRREKTGETAARAQRCHLVPRLHDHAIHPASAAGGERAAPAGAASSRALAQFHGRSSDNREAG